MHLSARDQSTQSGAHQSVDLEAFEGPPEGWAASPFGTWRHRRGQPAGSWAVLPLSTTVSPRSLLSGGSLCGRDRQAGIVTFVDRNDSKAVTASRSRWRSSSTGNARRELLAPRLRWVHCDHAGLDGSAIRGAARTTASRSRRPRASPPRAGGPPCSSCSRCAYEYPLSSMLSAGCVWGILGREQLRGLHGRTVVIVGTGHSERPSPSAATR